MTLLLLNVAGGLAIFIFGMKMMSDGLHCAAGERMRSILRFFSSNRIVAISSGAAVTAVIQSSSATTVMVIGFVNAGLLNLMQAIGIIFGANIGTTITAQLIAFEISWIIMPSIILGVLLSFINRPILAGWGETIAGLGFLFLGMQLMSDELRQLSSHPAFVKAFSSFDCTPLDGSVPFLPLMGAIGIGLAATLVIQSSSACTGIIIALGAGGLINLYTAVALVLGSNIGTTVTAQIAAIPANRVAKQAALAHTLFNVIGVVVIALTFLVPWGETGMPAFFGLVDWISADGDLPRKIANAHTVFNVCTTLLLVLFIPHLARLCEHLIPVGQAARVQFRKLEPLLLDTPEIALGQTAAALRKMLKKAWKTVDCALDFARLPANEKPKGELDGLDEKEARIDLYQRDITDYLAQLMQRPLSQTQATRIPKLIHCTNDAERIGDHTATIRDLTMEFRRRKGKLSPEAQAEFDRLHTLLTQQAECALALLRQPSAEATAQAVRLESDIIRLCGEFESNHLKRLNARQCHPVSGLFYIELLAEMSKISRHFANITERAGACCGAPDGKEISV